ncbi:hypothetical protein NDU88_006839 [Pleurodeles waltl]|uniref:Uncharacterized protein n=1 Tax=Pleurodeles waltl TaxID=8319 RepID=A0AAV7VN07_PLEWA|nr:hypothetical protein NDU88_006839 [Pleurodeles waltl]
MPRELTGTGTDKQQRLSGTGAGPQATDSPQGVEEAGTQRLENLCHTPAARDAHRKEQNVEEVGTRQLENLRLPPTARDTHRKVQKALWYRGRTTIPRLLRGSGGDGNPVASKPAVHSCSAGRSSKSAEGALVTGQDHKPQTVQREWRRWEPSGLKTCATLRKHGMRPGEDRVRLRLEEAGTSLFRVVGTLDALMLVGPMIRCPGGTLESIALEQCDAEKKQEVYALEGKEEHAEREDADEQKKEDNYTEATRTRESGNGEETGESDPPTNRGRTAVTKGPCGIQKHATSLEEVRARIRAVSGFWGDWRRQEPGSLKTCTALLQRVTLIRKRRRLSGTGAGPQATDSPQGVEEAGTQRLENLCHTPAARDAHRKEQNVEEVGTRQLENLRLPPTARDTHRKVQKALWYRGRTTIPRLLRGSGGDGNPVASKPAVHSCSAGRSSKSAEGALVTGQDHKPQTVQREWRRWEPSGLKTCATLRKHGMRPGEDRVRLRLEEAGTSLFRVVGTLDALMLVGPMIRCPGGTSESIALEQCDAEKKQEVYALEGKEEHAEREDADEQKKEDNYTEATRTRESGNGEETGESDPPTNRGRTAVTKGPCGIQKHATSLEEVRARIRAVSGFWGDWRRQEPGSLKTCTALLQRVTLIRKRRRLSGTGAGPQATDSPQGVEEAGTQRLENLCHTPAARDAHRKEQNVEEVGTRQLENLRLPPTARDTHRKVQKALWYRGRTTIPRLLRGSGGDGNPVASKPAVHSCSAGRSSKSAEGALVTGQDHKPQTVQREWRRWEPSGLKTCATLRKHGMRPGEDRVRLRLEEAGTSLFRVVGTLDALMLVGPMIRCPGGTSESIALEQCDAEKKQEVYALEGKEEHAEREDADEQKKEDNYTEATRTRESGNGEETGESDPPTNRGRTAVTKGPCGIQKHATSLEEVRARIRAVSGFWVNPAGTGEKANEDKRAGRKYNIYLNEKQGKYL